MSGLGQDSRVGGSPNCFFYTKKGNTGSVFALTGGRRLPDCLFAPGRWGPRGQFRLELISLSGETREFRHRGCVYPNTNSSSADRAMAAWRLTPIMWMA